MEAPIRLYVVWDGDRIGALAGRARLADDVEEVRRVAHAIDRGNALFTSWALRNGGASIETGGDEGAVEVPAAALAELPAIRQAYYTATDATASVGVGKKLSEASKALFVAKTRGRDRVVAYSPDVDAEISAAPQQTEQQKMSDEYLGKAAEGSGAPPPISDSNRLQPKGDSGEHSEGAVAHLQAEVPQAPEAQAPVDGFHAAAQRQDRDDRSKQVRQSADMHKLKLGVASALGDLRSQLPVLAHVKAAAPSTYQAIMRLVQSVVVMARGLQDEDQKMAKSERRRWTGGGLTIPALGTPDRDKWEAGFKSSLAGYFANGDASALVPKTLKLTQLERASVRPDDHPRTKLYRRMAKQDALPPLLVAPTGTGSYHVLDGNHRLRAAQMEGLESVPVYERRSMLRKDEPQVDAAMTLGEWHGDEADEDLEKAIPGISNERLQRIKAERLAQEEVLPEEKMPPETKLDKESLDAGRHLNLPVGTLIDGRLKVAHADGTTSFKGVRAGLIQGNEAGGIGGGGSNSHAVSSREPNSK